MSSLSVSLISGQAHRFDRMMKCFWLCMLAFILHIWWGHSVDLGLWVYLWQKKYGEILVNIAVQGAGGLEILFFVCESGKDAANTKEGVFENWPLGFFISKSLLGCNLVESNRPVTVNREKLLNSGEAYKMQWDCILWPWVWQISQQLCMPVSNSTGGCEQDACERKSCAE